MNNNGNDNQFNNYYGGSGSNDNYGQPNFSSGQDFDPNSQNYSGGNYSGGFNPNQQYQDNSFNKDANSYGNYNGFNNGYGSGYNNGGGYNNGSYYNNQPSSGSFDNDPNQGKAVAALVMGIIGFSLALLGIVFFWGFSCSAVGAASRLSTYLYDSSDLAGASLGVIASAIMTVAGFITSIVGVVLGVASGAYFTTKHCNELIEKCHNYYLNNAEKISNSYIEADKYLEIRSKLESNQHH